MDRSIPENLDGLIGLSRRHGVDIRPTLLRVLTDLYVQKQAHSLEEERQYIILALRLIELVDPATRAIVGRTLAAYPGAPAAVLRRLSGEDAPAVETAAAAAPQTAPSQGAAPRTIAPHAAPPQSTVVRLRGPQLQPPPHPQAAEPPPWPATALAPPRTPGSAASADLGALFFAVDAAERRLILANLPFVDAVTLQRRLPGDSRAAIHQIERATLAGRAAEVVREFERALGIPRATAQKIIDDAGGEPIVVAAKALDMPLAVLQRILLFVNPAIGHSVQRVYDLSALFEDISADSARHLVSLWRDPPADQRRSAHRPLAFDDEMRRPRGEPQRRAERLGTLDEDDDIFLDRA